MDKRDVQKKINKLVNRLKDHYKPDKIILFGSFARGDYHEGSDVDLIVIKDDVPDNFLRRLDEVLDFCDGEIEVQILVYKKEEIKRMLEEGNDFIRTVLKEGKVIYERQ